VVNDGCLDPVDNILLLGVGQVFDDDMFAEFGISSLAPNRRWSAVSREMTMGSPSN
jgi:hypothetical protein